MTYQHSETFAQLKVIKEDIAGNLTTYQWLHTLDFFIEMALDPIVTAYPDLADNYFAKVVAWQSNKPSIKFSREDKEGMPVLLFNSLTTHNATKRRYQKAMLLNRGLLYGLMSVFSHTVNNYKKLHDPWFPIKPATRLRLLRKAETLTGSPFLYASIREFEFWSTKAYKFKELILQKYIRLTLMQAQHAYKEIEHTVKLDDVVQIYLAYLSKAVDRCDARQGVLTTFIKQWFYSARTEVLKLSAIVNSNTSYEGMLESGLAMSVVAPDSSYETWQHISHVSKTIDPKGVVRFSLGIPEFFTKSQRATLKLFTTH